MKLKNFIAIGLVAAPAAALAGPALNGAGATFPAPIIRRNRRLYPLLLTSRSAVRSKILCESVRNIETRPNVLRN